MLVYQQLKEHYRWKSFHKKENIVTMILTSNQMKVRKLFWDKYLEDDWSKYIFTDVVVFEEEMRSRKWTTEREKYVIAKAHWALHF